MILPERKTMREISIEWRAALQSGKPAPSVYLGNLLDDFRDRCPTPAEKIALIAEPPEPTGEAETDSYLAALAESLCGEFGMRAPDWTDAPASYLPRPWFAGGLENLKAILLVESPPAFRRRNLFISANALHRA
jgi:hypothetical protein